MQLRQEAEVGRANEAKLRQEAEAARANEAKLRQEAEVARASEARFRKQAEVRLTIYQAGTLFSNGKYDQAETLLNGIEPSLIEPDAGHANLRLQLAEKRVAKNQWSAATTNLAVLLQMDGTTWGFNVACDYYFYATAVLEAGDQAGYERFRKALVKSSVGTTEWRGAEFICLITLLTPADEGWRQLWVRAMTPPRRLKNSLPTRRKLR